MEENDNSTYHYFLVISPYLYFHFFSGLYILIISNILVTI